MADQLDREIAAYERLLPQLQRDHGSAWVVISGGALAGAFDEFAAAARFARERFGKTPVLIRHTGSRRVESAPFIHLDAAS